MLVFIENLEKSYISPTGQKTKVLDIKSWGIGAGARIALAGPSGSGKTTLLYLLAGLALPTSGIVTIDGQAVSAMKEEERDRFRSRNIGYVFQNINLLDSLTALENVMVAAHFGGRGRRAGQRERAKELLDMVQLSHRMNNYPRQMSRGEQQRVAIARALVNKPKLVLADEPTASLDKANGLNVMGLLTDICFESDSSLIIASHDPAVLHSLDDIYHLRDGSLEKEAADINDLAIGMA